MLGSLVSEIILKQDTFYDLNRIRYRLVQPMEKRWQCTTLGDIT